jgi:hypothetical protein
MNIATPIAHGCCDHRFEPELLHPTVSKLFMPSGVDGVYGRSGAYESVVEALAALISRHRPEAAEVFRFAPVMPRASLEKQGYLKSFPNLIGAVSTLVGSDRDIARSAAKHEDGGDWTEDLRPSDLVLAPPVIRSIPLLPSAARCRTQAMSSTSPPTVSVTSRRAMSTASRAFACANMSASVPRRRSRPSANPGWNAPRASPMSSA